MQLKSSEFLLNIRLCFSSAVVAHLLFAAVTILPIDMSQDEDPKISAYSRLKWKLLTCWFNVIMLAYFPVSIYCDWKNKTGEWNNKQVRLLRNVKDIVMTSILFPTVMYSDYFFWRMWYQDPSLIAPIGIYKYLPPWGQHSLHTVSGLTVLLDILLTPRRRPHSIIPGLMLMFAFCAIYSLVITVSYYNGDVLYSVIDIFNKQKKILLISLGFIEHIFFFTLQWCIIDSVYGKRVKNIEKCS